MILRDYEFSNIQTQIRNKLSLDKGDGLFFFINGNKIESPSKFLISDARIGDIYERSADEDGFLYITFSNQETFGI